jgi:hypothetical protein
MEDVKNSRDEMEGVELNEAILRRWIADLGPVARRVFNPVKGYKYLNAAISDIGKQDFEGIVDHATSQINTTSTNKFKHSHRLLLMLPSDDFETYDFVPSSVEIGRRILDKSFRDSVEDAKSLMGKMSGAHLGLVFEPYAHFMLARGGKFPVRKLLDNSEQMLQLASSMQTVKVANKDLLDGDNFESNQYYIPKDASFPVVDSWTVDEMFQVTVSMSHPIKSGSKLFKNLKGKGVAGRLYFVVPNRQMDQFTLQPHVKVKGDASASKAPQGSWSDIEQYVLGL